MFRKDPNKKTVYRWGNSVIKYTWGVWGAAKYFLGWEKETRLGGNEPRED